jgi:predicted HTH transcriptional regulator
MPASQSYIDELIANPREQLAVEIKEWIDPDSPHGQAKIVKGCIALRNHNGGFLQVGFQNATWIPELTGAHADVRAKWDQDDIQALVSKYASELFEVHVHFGERDGQEFPVLEVESGFRSPVASKADLFDPADAEGKRRLVKEHTVYVRSLAANNTVSTAEAKHGDWSALVERCFDNREADIGRFARRQLSNLDPEILRAVADALEGRSVT